MITIGQLAAYAGGTIKAVRHYHKRGLLEEPTRDSSDYRRYTAQHAIDLVKIKTLAEAGVPLARVKELLGASPERFAGAMRAVDQLFVSADVAGYLDRLRELGVSKRSVQMERDGWILLQSASPKAAAIWFAEKVDSMNDPEFVAIYLEYDAAFDWPADDPRLEALADRSARWFA